MAYTFQVPRQKPLTQGAQLAEDQNTRGLATGQYADVQSAAGATDRTNALRTSNALQATRGTFARSGQDFSPEAAARAQDQSFSAAEAQNLNGTNAVNQLQRQYRNDAMTNANQYESAANQRQQQGISNDQFQQTFGAGREDAQTAKNQFGETMAQRKNEFGTTSGQTQQQIDQASSHFLQSQAQRDKEFGVSSGQNQQQINNQSNQFNQSYQAGREDANTSKSQFDLTRGDKNSQFSQTLGQNQQQIDNQAKQAAEKMGYDYASLSQNDKQFFADKAMKESQFGVTSGQNQQQINNQASQFGQNYQAGREDAATSKSQFDLTRGDKNSQFDVTSGQNQQQINNQAGQFNQTLNQNSEQFNAKMGQDASQFNVTSGQTQQQIDAAKSQFDLTRGDKQKAMTMDEINSIQDPVARNQALKAYYSGGNVGETISGNIGADGQLINHQMSPGTAAYQAQVDQLQATYPNKTPEEINKMVQDRAAKADTVSQGVVDTGVKSVAVSAAKDVLATNPASLNPDQKDALVASGDIKHYNTATAIPVGPDAHAMAGQPVKVGNDFYTVSDGGSVITQWNKVGHDNNHKLYTTLIDGSGNEVYVVDGVLTNDKPVDARRPNMFGF